jgi:hypothetical protein
VGDSAATSAVSSGTVASHRENMLDHNFWSLLGHEMSAIGYGMRFDSLRDHLHHFANPITKAPLTAQGDYWHGDLRGRQWLSLLDAGKGGPIDSHTPEDTFFTGERA